MCRELFHIYGPLSINAFGVMITLGVIVASWLLIHHPRRPSIMSAEQFIDLLFIIILTSMAGGRLLTVITDWSAFESWIDIFKFWEGGYSMLGAIIGNLIVLPWYLRAKKINTLACLDLIGLHAPLLQSIARFGCFFAGCCYGKPTDLPWGVVYTDSGCVAPTQLCIHPTQLYSSFLLFLIFVFLYFFVQLKVTRNGQLFGAYIFLAGLERFVVDFWRDDHDFSTNLGSGFAELSIYQWISLGVACSGLLLIYAVRSQPMIRKTP